jgi:hypothetical protein
MSREPPAGDGAAIVLFSGGQDSTTCLAWALERFDRVETIAFDYRQRHGVELECRKSVLAEFRHRFPQWTAKLGEHHLVDLGVLAEISETALTGEGEIRLGEKGLPTTFVPGRNILFLTMAAAVGYRRGLRHLVAGVCETDYSGYPDCAQPRHGGPLRRPHAVDVAGQGRNLAACREPRRGAADRDRLRAHPHLLPRRALSPPRLGLWLRRLPGLPAPGGGVRALQGRRMTGDYAYSSR